jgi:hypothetical protein
MGNIHIEPGVALPHRLVEYEQCISVADFKTIAALLSSDVSYLGNKAKREVRPIVILGNGRTIRGNSLRIPQGVTVEPDSNPQKLINITTKRTPDDLLDPAITYAYLRSALRRTYHRMILALKRQHSH